MTDTDFDVICYGASIAAYIAAKKCSDLGMRVLVIDPSVNSSANIPVDSSVILPAGFDYDDFPVFEKMDFTQFKVQSNPIVKLEEHIDGIIMNTFGLNKTDYRIFADHVSNVSNEYRNQYQLTSHETKYFKNMKLGRFKVSDLLKESLRRYRFVTNSTQVNDYSNVIQSVMMSDSNADPLTISHEHLFRMIPLIRGKRIKLAGGLTKLKSEYARLLRKNPHSGVKTEIDIHSLYVDEQQVKGVVLNTYDGVIRADSVIICSHHARLYKTIPDDLKKNETLGRLRKVEKRHSRLRLKYKLDSELVNIRSEHLVLLQDTFGGPDAEYNVLIECATGDALSAEATATATANISIMTTYPVTASHYNVDVLRRYIARLSHTLTGLAPFAESSINAQTSGTIGDGESLKHMLGEIYHNEENAYYYIQGGSRNAPAFLGLHWITGNKGLYFAGKPVFPAYGFYGEYLSALKAVDDINKTTKSESKT